ncbi:MAG: ImmA/IrrE family metallo-endopeptidase [Terracidiphilus sp.]
MLKALLEDAGLKPEACAALLGIAPHMFDQWVNKERDIAGFIIPELASILGVDPKVFKEAELAKAPAIWFKFRNSGTVKEQDRELVVLIRRLGFYLKQLNSVIGFSGDKWQVHFQLVSKKLEPARHESPVVQGEIAARVLRENINLGFSHKALPERVSAAGDVIRGILRNLGILIIEMPVPESSIDGCSFYVGESGADLGTPCLFINTFRQNWFRRNYVLAHELAHAIFDIAGESALVDSWTKGNRTESSVMEARADSFARNCFVSREILKALTSTLGLNWAELNARNLAELVAHSQVDLRVILASAVECNLISEEQSSKYGKMRIIKHLRGLTSHALTTKEFFEAPRDTKVWSPKERETTIPSRTLRLPVPYVKSVIDACNDGLISEGKAAELLMIDYEIFMERFGSVLVELAA